MNSSSFKLFSSPLYKPVWKSIPAQSEWQRVTQTTLFSMNFATSYKFSWNFDCFYSDNDVYFATAPPYSYEHLLKSLDLYQSICPNDCIFYRETLTKSLDNRNIEIITISAKRNFTCEREERVIGIYPSSLPRSFKANKPIVFISARVHPGETPASYMLDSIIQCILAKDLKGNALRNQFVFKIVPMLNPDGVSRGHFRVDQNGINLNRCYAYPSMLDHPSIYAVKVYIENIIAQKVCFYLDLHAHGSRKSCFVFGNCLSVPEQVDNELFGKLLELNSQYFDYSESDFNQKNMTAKDPKDHHSKEGSGRVAFYKSIGITYSYTVEASYFIPRSLHVIAPLVNMKTGKKCLEEQGSEKYLIQVYNRNMFIDVGAAILASVMDVFKVNPLSRIPATEYKTVDRLKETLLNFILNKKQNKLKKCISRSDFSKGNKLELEKKTHKLPLVTPNSSERSPEFTNHVVCRFKSTYKYSTRPKTFEAKSKTFKYAS